MPNFNNGLDTAIDVMAWMSIYIPMFYMDVITYPYPDPGVGLANRC